MIGKVKMWAAGWKGWLEKNCIKKRINKKSVYIYNTPTNLPPFLSRLQPFVLQLLLSLPSPSFSNIHIVETEFLFFFILIFSSFFSQHINLLGENKLEKNHENWKCFPKAFEVCWGAEVERGEVVKNVHNNNSLGYFKFIYCSTFFVVAVGAGVGDDFLTSMGFSFRDGLSGGL